nr:DUF2142 domain-containing protein [Acetobacter musti]
MSVCLLALCICAPSARIWLVYCLCIPEIFQLFCSYSQDGGNTAFIVLAAAFLTRLKSEAYRSGYIYIATALLACFVMAKPPYITFLLIPLIMSYGRNTAAALRALGLSLFAILLWSGLGLIPVLAATSSDPHVSAAGQIHNLMQHPFYIFTVLWNTFRLGYYGQAGDYMARTCIATLAWGWMAEQGRWFYWRCLDTVQRRGGKTICHRAAGSALYAAATFGRIFCLYSLYEILVAGLTVT